MTDPTHEEMLEEAARREAALAALGIDYDSLIHIITELCDRIEQLEKDNELLKSYAWEQ